jgi:integrase
MYLTTKTIENAKKEDDEYFLKDGGGLRVAVKPTGSKTFQHRIRVKVDGKWKEKIRTLGRFPQYSLKEARDWRDKNNEYKAKGILPPTNYDTMNQVSDGVITFKDVYEKWFDKQKNGDWKPSYSLDVQQRTEMYILPPLAYKDINAIDTKMLIDLLLKIDLEGKYDTREKIQSLLTRIHKYAVGMGWAKSNPAREISSDLFTKKEKKHFAHPENLKDVKLVMSLIPQAIGSKSVTTALNLAPYMFLRPSELAGLRWSEFDWEDKSIKIPKERMKVHNKPHIVPMSSHLIKVFTELKDSNLDSTFCFPSPVKKGRSITTNAILTSMRAVGVDKELSTVHGFRHMAVTILNEKGYNGDAIELQVSHAIPGVRGRYNHAKYLEQRKPMMEDWSQFLLNL